MLKFVPSPRAHQAQESSAEIEHNPQYAERITLWVVAQNQRAFPPPQLEAEYNYFKSDYLTHISDDARAAFLKYESVHRLEMMQRFEDFTTVIAHVCSACGLEDATKKCTLCKLEYYCDKDCQRADWTEHKRDVCVAQLIELPSVSGLSLQDDAKEWITWSHSRTALRCVPYAEIQRTLDMSASVASSTSAEDPDVVKFRTAYMRFGNPICAREGCSNRSRTHLKACARCCLVLYCSKNCQVKDLGEHNRRCGNVHGPAEEGKLRPVFLTSPRK